MSRSVVLNVPGKINLSLEVLGRRADGYHEIAGIFATIDLRDRVRVAHARNLDVRVSPPVVGEDLSARAVNALAGATGRAPHAHVRVRKRIPVAAGLGGGSADAAAVLRGLARLWRVDGIDLCAVGAGIGSDVPFFASAAPFALVRGRGELVEPLPMPAVPLWIVLVNVAGQVSTAAVFATVSARRAQSTHATAIATMLREGGATPGDLRAHLVNDLGLD